ncbi:MAG TPA: DUF559 domain-containing protein [Caulobacteraceae bacterium]|jgi:very-short-patch-repair endonuclease|nr:DUF559 domain-containing protein [Caulobacteraceae bacterium]
MELRPETLQKARDLRRRMSPPEVVLWQAIRGSRLGYKIRRQHCLGPYIVDFFCVAAKLAIEIDGPSHEDRAQVAHDARRDGYLLERGVRTVRIPSVMVMTELDHVVAKLQQWIERCVEANAQH